MKLPRGQLRRRRVVANLGTMLASALEETLTGYARLEPQETLLLDEQSVGVLTFENGIPTLAYHTETQNGGADALSEIAVTGPTRFELYELDAARLPDASDAPELAVRPGQAAELLAGDSELAQRTRTHAPDDCHGEKKESELAAVEAFLEDSEKIDTIRERAREQAAMRADEWGFASQCADKNSTEDFDQSTTTN